MVIRITENSNGQIKNEIMEIDNKGGIMFYVIRGE